ncbi:MAG TPA: hypothetical protein VHS05_10825 [Pyrinomonadaceae bacterium]|nr:hypothetical protein [Pyrinomonadaceae bacterium]
MDFRCLRNDEVKFRVLVSLRKRYAGRPASLLTMGEFPIGRALSLIIAAVYLVVSGLFAKSIAHLLADLLFVGGALLLPMACIWFAEELGEYIGTLPGPRINRRSPAWMVKIGGWVLLLLPAIIFLFVVRS